MLIPLAVVKAPPASSRAAVGPFPSGSHATSALTAPLNPVPSVPHVDVLGVQYAMRLAVTPPAVVNAPPTTRADASPGGVNCIIAFTSLLTPVPIAFHV